MKRRTYLKGLASVSAITTIGATGASAAPGDGDDVVVLDDDSGDNFGDGSLEHPTNSAFHDEAWDLDQFRIGRDSDRIYFDFQFVNLENGFGESAGWSQEYIQVYIKDPNAGSGVPTDDAGVTESMNVDFESAYQYVLIVNPGGQAFEDAGGNSVVNSSELTLTVDGDTISVSVPRDTVEDISEVELCPIIAPYNGVVSDGLRSIQSSAGEYAIGGGDENTPKVMDMIAPEGVSQSDALSTSGRFADLNLPYVDISAVGGPSFPDVGGVTPTDTDGDGQPEDFDGDGDADADDALAYYEHRKSGAVRDNPQFFDYNGDGNAGQVSDALELYQQLTGN